MNAFAQSPARNEKRPAVPGVFPQARFEIRDWA